MLARIGEDSLAAHLIAFQLFVFLALVLDAVAIAGQVIVGRALGAGDAEGARRAARRMIEWAVVAGGVFAVVMLALIDVLPHAFTGDPGWSTGRRRSGRCSRSCSRPTARCSRSTGS